MRKNFMKTNMHISNNFYRMLVLRKEKKNVRICNREGLVMTLPKMSGHTRNDVNENTVHAAIQVFKTKQWWVAKVLGSRFKFDYVYSYHEVPCVK